MEWQQMMKVTVYVGESAHRRGRALYHLITLEARKRGIRGVTVVRGFEGYGRNSQVKSANLLDLSTDLPVKIEIVDDPGRLEGFLDYLDSILEEGLITRERIDAHLAAPERHPR